MTENTQSKKYIDRAYIAGIVSVLFYAATSLLVPLSIENIRSDLALSFTQAGMFSFISSIEQFIIMILSCFLAARIGKIRVLRIAILILALGLLLFSRSNVFYVAIICYLIIGIGHGFLEAMLTPLVVDLYPKDKGSRQILLHAFWPIGIISVSPIIGFALTNEVSWRLIFVVFSVLTLLVFFVYPSSKKLNLPRSSTDFTHIRQILTTPMFWIFVASMICAAGAEGAFTFWMSSYIQNVFKQSQLGGAIGAACFAGGMAVGRISFSRIAKIASLFKIILFCASILLLLSVFFLLAKSITALYILVFASGLMIAPFWPSIQTLAVQTLNMDATLIMVFLSCFGIPGFSTAVMLIGILADRYGFLSGFLIVPVFATLLVICMITILGISRRKNKAGN